MPPDNPDDPKDLSTPEPPEAGSARSELLLEIRRNSSRTREVIKLTGSRLVIGRNTGLAIELKDESVSRIHAELVSDLYDRWWIHDLESTNGTFVNGNPVSRRMLHLGDTIQLGDYSLQLRMPGSLRQPRLTDPPPGVEERGPSTTRAGPELAVKVGATHLARATAFNRALVKIENRAMRLTRLCENAVAGDFPILAAWVASLEVEQPAKLLVGPAYAGEYSREYEPTKLIEFSQTHWIKFDRRDRPQVLEAPELGGLVVGCPLERTARGVDVLYVEFPRAGELGDWIDLIALLGEGYRQASELWTVKQSLRRGAEIDHDIRMAQVVQSRLVPRSPSIEGLELAIGYEPCQWVGGDYVDAVPMPDGRVLLVVADVCGKGLQAALVASSLHSFVHVLVESALSLPQLTKRMNTHLREILPEHSFVTMVCVAVDPLTGEIECINAGHPPAFLADGQGNVRQLQSKKNFALGMLDLEPLSDHYKIVSERYTMLPGEVLLLYTDGVTESEDSQRDAMGVDKLMTEFGKIVSSLPNAKLNTMSRCIAETIRIYRGSLMAKDDTTFLMARPDPIRGLLQFRGRELGPTLFPPPSSH